MATATVAASYSIDASSLAFYHSPDLDFLAAGGRARPVIALLRVRGGGADLSHAVTIPALAPICRLSWSRPRGTQCWASGCPAGLLAGGLKNGIIEVWDPKDVLMLMERDAVVLDDYFTLKPEVNQIPCYAANLAAEDNRDSLQNTTFDEASGEEEARWIVPFKIFDDHFANEGKAQPGRELSANVLTTLKGHEGPVRGLSFNPTVPHLLASGGTQGRMMIWDVAKPSSNTIPYFEFLHNDSTNISYLSWNPLMSRVVSSASNVGVTMWDIDKKSLVREFPWTRDCSMVQWNPKNQDEMVIAAGDYSNLPSIQVWDVRSMEKPLKEFCENTQGIVALSWSQFDEEILVACTRSNKILMLNVRSGVIISEKEAPGTCADILWCNDSKDQFAIALGEGEGATVRIRGTE